MGPRVRLAAQEEATTLPEARAPGAGPPPAPPSPSVAPGHLSARCRRDSPSGPQAQGLAGLFEAVPLGAPATLATHSRQRRPPALRPVGATLAPSQLPFCPTDPASS